jgi:CRISPR-associated endonuclease Csn1
MPLLLGLDIGSNSLGSALIDTRNGKITVGLSVFPAGVDESDEKRGDPKNAKRRAVRRARITLARRAARKRLLRVRLIAAGLLPPDAAQFQKLLEQSDPWGLRCKGLDGPLAPHEFGRVLLHLAQRRGAAGLRVAEDDQDAAAKDDGKVKAAIADVHQKMRERNARTFGEFIAMVRADRVTPITTEDRRQKAKRNGPREYRAPIRNRAGSYEHCADREMIRKEFGDLWDRQKSFGGDLAKLLTDDLRKELDDAAGDADWRQKGLLFGQRKATWDLGTLGRCVLEPTERCVPHADMYASRYLVVETVNNLKIIERGKEVRPLTPDERAKILSYLSSQLGVITKGNSKGQPKRSVTVSDLRELMGWGASRTSQFRFNIEADEHKIINTDWFNREIVHGAVTQERWQAISAPAKEGINRAILKHDPDDEKHPAKLKALVMQPWAGLSETQADNLVAAWKKRPRPDAKRLTMSRHAVRNILPYMEGAFVFAERKPDEVITWRLLTEAAFDPAKHRWPTQIEARKIAALDKAFHDAVSGKPLDEATRRRYQTGAKGSTARDRHFQAKHLLRKDGKEIYREDGLCLHVPPPAPLIGNPVVRKAIHEVRRHLIEQMIAAGARPDRVTIELAREAKMSKVRSDELLFRNRLRNRIRNEIVREFVHLGSVSSTQQRTAVDRVILCVQQRGACPLCGDGGLTPLNAAKGQDCELAHVIPKGAGGHNGLANVVLAHAKCNRDMARRTPRQFWNDTAKGGFDAAISRIEHLYGEVERPRAGELKSLTGEPLWRCYFDWRDDRAKVERFKLDVKDIQEMTPRQLAATTYAARQVMSYLSDALFDGTGLPERGGERLIFASDGLWTSRLRREWGLFFDPHGKKKEGLTTEEERERGEKDRGDHRHHAIDAIVIAIDSPQIRHAWEEREKAADRAGVNTADEVQMAAFRKANPLPVRLPFANREELREAVRRAVYGNGDHGRPVSHRPVKRKIVGALHEETLFGPALDQRGNLTENYTAKKSVLQLDPNHLRMPQPESRKGAIARLTEHFKSQGNKPAKAKQLAETAVGDPGYRPLIVDQPPGKSGIVRDLALRRRLRECLSGYRYVKKSKGGEPTGETWFVNPDDFTDNEIKQAFEAGAFRQKSGVPIKSVVLLRTMSDPVIIDRRRQNYATGHMERDDNPASKRAYVGGNNHHIEIRVDAKSKWRGEVVPAYEVARRKLAKLRAFRAAGVPKPDDMRKLSNPDREKLRPIIQGIEQAHPLVDRRDDAEKGGRFVMSLSEGETLLMKHKVTGEVGYFVVAEIEREKRRVVLVPHWDARRAGARKDSEGNAVADSERDEFKATTSDLKDLAPPGENHAVKVRVSPLGVVRRLKND